MKSFITDVVKDFPIKVKIFSKYDSKNNYDKLDSLAQKRGYYPIEIALDEKVDISGLIGMQNFSLHSGWVATIDDYNIKAMHQIKALNQKIELCKSKGEQILIGFCQTGKFSIGYTIYTKRCQCHRGITLINGECIECNKTEQIVASEYREAQAMNESQQILENDDYFEK